MDRWREEKVPLGETFEHNKKNKHQEPLSSGLVGWEGSRGGWVGCSWLRLSLSQRSSGRFRCR